MEKHPAIDARLLWEFDTLTFNWDLSWKLVIERVIQFGGLNDWREIYQFYGTEKILAVAEWSKQLDKRDKAFTRLFINSDLLNAA